MFMLIGLLRVSFMFVSLGLIKYSNDFFFFFNPAFLQTS